jgi:hypothetical protein
MHSTRAFCGLIAFILFISLAIPSVALADSKNIKLRAVLVANDGRGTIHNAFVPVDTLQPWQAFKRVPGVGVSAIIELRI